MKNFKVQLLAASAVAGLFSTNAQAQVALPASELHAAGASSIANILVQSFNCIGQPDVNYSGAAVTTPTGLNQLGKSNGSLTTITPFNFVGTPARDCAVKEIQPSVQGRYISTGSGDGKTWYTTFAKPAAVVSTATTVGGFPSGTAGGLAWTNLQLAFSDSPLSDTEVNTYNSTVAGTAHAPIQVPLYVLPVAISYNPVYAKYNKPGTGPVDLKLRLKFPRANSSGGLRLSKVAYCKILNGSINNFNDPLLKTINGNQSLMDLNDDTARWNSVGVPIRLVGRADKSGTTDIFTHSLQAQCDVILGAANNVYDNRAESLPFNPLTGPDMSTLPGIGSTQYKPTGTGFAGTTTSISGAYFNKATLTIDTTKGTEAPGKFMIAVGSDGVAAAVNYQPAAGSNPGDIALNGKVAYIGADWVLPSTLTGTTLNSADLQAGTASAPLGSYFAPTAANATAAFGTTILPPQSIAASGAFNTTDSRTSTNTINGTHTVSRTIPQDWVDVTSAIADPAKGYAITGTTQALLYTCYKSAADRFAVTTFFGVNFGKVSKDSLNVTFSTNLFKGVAATNLGILASNGIAPMPAAWQNAINETFFKKSTQASGGVVLGTIGGNGLWIQSALPTNAASLNTIKSNPTCTAGTGA